MTKDSLGDRAKAYEDAFRTHLPGRMPALLRIDGCHFHTYTKGCKKPFDANLVSCMNDTAIYLCKNIQNTQLAYVQSDEITLLMVNYNDIGTQSWFDNNAIKMCSVAAGMASSYFTSISDRIFGKLKIAYFDCRAFVVPREDVNNILLWRQQDATRNSVQMVARSLYSHKEVNNKNNSQMQEMISKKGIDWSGLPTEQKRGRCIVKERYNKNGATRSRWIVDNEIPIFSQDTKYINELVFPLMTLTPKDADWHLEPEEMKI